MNGVCRQLDLLLLSKFIISAYMKSGFDHAQPPKRNWREKHDIKNGIEFGNMFYGNGLPELKNSGKLNGGKTMEEGFGVRRKG
jgi:hypothetical protein